MADLASDTSILIVEDDEHIAYILEFLLTREGFVVQHAADGREALRIIESSQPPVLVLLDLMLPYHDGFALIGSLRRQPGWEAVPIIMLTAKSQEQDIVRALEAGASDYILKPFQPHELLARVRRLIGVRA